MSSGFHQPAPLWLRRALRPQVAQLKDFKGGWNPRDSAEELAENEWPDGINMTCDPRGGVVGRTGYAKVNPAAVLGGASATGFMWETQQGVVVQDGTAIKFTTDFVTWTTLGSVSTSARVGMVEFKSELIVVHPVDGVYYATTSAASLTLITAAVKGNAASVWQNKVYVIGDPGNRTRAWWSNPGDAHTFTTATDWIDFREGGDAALVGIGFGQGMDVLGRGGLYVWKTVSFHRVNSSTTGAYTTLDNAVGPVGPFAIAAAAGVTVVFTRRGLYRVDDANNQLVPVAPQLLRLISEEQLNFGKLSLVAGGSYKDRVLFSFPWGSSATVNGRTIEYHPVDGWVAPHTIPAGWFVNYDKNTDRLYFAHPSTGYLYRCFTGGTDDGAAIKYRLQTRWVAPDGDGSQAQLLHCRVHGRGKWTVESRLDFATGQGETDTLDFTTGGFIWNQWVWNDGELWGPTTLEGLDDFYVNERAVAVSFVFRATGSASASLPNLLGDGAPTEVGPVALFGLDLHYVPVEGV